jgi:hypothetical protein
MNKALRVTAATTVGLAALSLTAPAHAGGSAVGAGIIGFGIGAILGNLLTPSEVYVVPPPPPYYYGPVVYGPPPPYYYSEYDYRPPVVSVPPQGKSHSHKYHPPAHATPTAYDKPQPRTAKASRDDISP